MPISGALLARVAPYFDANLLRRTEVTRISRIANPLPTFVWKYAPAGALDLSTVRGMAFFDTIVLAEANARRVEDETSLVFHELVHIVQYDLLGLPGFVRAYMHSWLAAGRSYLDNPLERMAFHLQDRFDAGETFDVRCCVAAALANR